MEGCAGSVLSGEVFSVLLILMSHLSHTTATAVAEDNGEECYKELINSNVLTITISLSPSPSRVAPCHAILRTPPVHHAQSGGNYSEYPRQHAARPCPPLRSSALLPHGCQATSLGAQEAARSEVMQ